MLKIIKFCGISAEMLQLKIAIFKPNYKRNFFETGNVTTFKSLKKVS
jgi:hypothetical protein